MDVTDQQSEIEFLSSISQSNYSDSSENESSDDNAIFVENDEETELSGDNEGSSSSEEETTINTSFNSAESNNTAPVLSCMKICQQLTNGLQEYSDGCAICLSEFAFQKLGSPDCCDHIFCLDCIKKWSKRGYTCPIDRMCFTAIVIVT